MAFDTFYGWPNDGAIVDNAKPKSGEAIVAGMAIKKDANGELVKADGTEGDGLFISVQDQDAFDVDASSSLPYIVTNGTLLTDQFEAGAFGFGTEVSVSNANPGNFKVKAGVEPVVARSDGKVTRDGIEFLKLVFK